MTNKRGKFKPDFKAKGALKAPKRDRLRAELAEIFDVHRAQIPSWGK